jgi:hypothetical protein
VSGCAAKNASARARCARTALICPPADWPMIMKPFAGSAQSRTAFVMDCRNRDSALDMSWRFEMAHPFQRGVAVVVRMRVRL